MLHRGVVADLPFKDVGGLSLKAQICNLDKVRRWKTNLSLGLQFLHLFSSIPHFDV